MDYIDPHIHMVSRVTDDYARMAEAGCVAVSEPAFWAGFDRASPEGFRDYFRQLTAHEPKRAARYGIAHYTWLCINPKEAEDPDFARAVLPLIRAFLDEANVLGVGEIGLNKNTRHELAILEEQIGIAAERGELILVHTPHLEDKQKGTRLIMDALERNGAVSPQRVLIDHVEEHTIGPVLDRGFWAGMTLYPHTKCTPQRAVDMVERFGDERVCLNSAGDWGPSDPLSVPHARRELRRRGHSRERIERLTYHNPAAFFAQSGKFSVDEAG